MGPFLLLGLAFLMTSYCSRSDAEPLRLGGSGGGSFEAFRLGEELSYFGDNEVAFKAFRSPWDITRALMDQEIDAAVISRNAALRFLVQGVPIQLFTIGESTRRRYSVLAQPEIEHVKNLTGMRVGVEGGALAGYMVGGAITRRGVSLESVRFVHLAAGQHEAALAAGKVDAVVTTEPVRSRLLAAGARELLSPRDVSGEIADLLVVHSDYAKRERNRVDQVRGGWSNALRYIRKHPVRARDLVK